MMIKLKNGILYQNKKLVKGQIKVINIINSQYEINNNYDLGNKIIIPGLINIHLHLGESIYRHFLAPKLNLNTYIKNTNKIDKILNKQRDYRKTISEMTILEAIKNGTSHISGPRLGEIPNRFNIGFTDSSIIMNSSKLSEEITVLKKNITINQIPKNIFIHSLEYINQDELNLIRELKEKNKGIRIIIHVAETMETENFILKKYKKSSIQMLEDYKLLDKNTVLIHCNAVNEADYKKIFKAKSWIVYCPSTSLWLDGITLPLSKIAKKYNRICIATDGSATGGTFSLLSEARLAYMYHNKDTYNISAEKIFKMITINPSKALGIDINEINLTILNSQRGQLTEENFYHQLILNETNHSVFGVVSKGNLIYTNTNNLLFSEDVTKKYNNLVIKSRQKIKNALQREKKIALEN